MELEDPLKIRITNPQKRITKYFQNVDHIIYTDCDQIIK